MAEERDYVELSDDDFVAAMESATTLPHDVDEESADDTEEQGETLSSDVNEADDDVTLESEDDLTEEDSETGELDSDEEDGEEDETESDVDESDEEESEIPEEYKQALEQNKEFQRILEPFKANGKEMSVKDVDEAMQLMKMGANYVKKMTVMKPHLNAVKLLQRNDLLDQDKLNTLIDISKGNTDAIASFLQTLNVDPADLIGKEQEASSYKPNEYKIDEAEEAVVDVLETIKSDSPSEYNNLVSNVINQWDTGSNRLFGERPEILEVLVENMQNKNDQGQSVFELVNTELQRQKTLGKTKGQNDLEAYFAIGQAMFSDNSEQKPESSEVKEKQLPPKSKKAKAVKTDKRKVAVGSGVQSKRQPAAKQKTAQAEKMADDDFQAWMDSQLNGN